MASLLVTVICDSVTPVHKIRRFTKVIVFPWSKPFLAIGLSDDSLDIWRSVCHPYETVDLTRLCILVVAVESSYMILFLVFVTVLYDSSAPVDKVRRIFTLANTYRVEGVFNDPSKS